MEKKGFTIIEAVLFLGLAAMFFCFTAYSLEKRKRAESFGKVKTDLTLFIRKIQKYGFHNESEYYLEFVFSEKKVLFKESGGEIIEELKLPGNIGYFSNNSDKKADFSRKTTKNGNFDKGFSIFLTDKKMEKIYYKISVSTVNTMKYPVISIYKAKKPIAPHGNYLGYSLWTEEM
jgi:hypothetical protein